MNYVFDIAKDYNKVLKAIIYILKYRHIFVVSEILVAEYWTLVESVGVWDSYSRFEEALPKDVFIVFFIYLLMQNHLYWAMSYFF